MFLDNKAMFSSLKNKHFIVFFVFLLIIMPQTQAQQYQNTVLSGFYPDTHIFSVYNDYHPKTFTIHYYPGLAVFYSSNLLKRKQCQHSSAPNKKMSYQNDKGISAPVQINHMYQNYFIRLNELIVNGLGNIKTSNDMTTNCF